MESVVEDNNNDLGTTRLIPALVGGVDETTGEVDPWCYFESSKRSCNTDCCKCPNNGYIVGTCRDDGSRFPPSAISSFGFGQETQMMVPIAVAKVHLQIVRHHETPATPVLLPRHQTSEASCGRSLYCSC
ncbi:hypothetical protein MUK42_24219 [Musa troglodytarum]|uniref:Uncharacterized protein n=1 Tax=Musa troglodytarum TaxID=320322 RepID=A0A9E7JMR2_9LILI|nr:hypothetical protein MUK42_24219 [Musa troglodytarum]